MIEEKDRKSHHTSTTDGNGTLEYNGRKYILNSLYCCR